MLSPAASVSPKVNMSLPSQRLVDQETLHFGIGNAQRSPRTGPRHFEPAFPIRTQGEPFGMFLAELRPPVGNPGDHVRAQDRQRHPRSASRVGGGDGRLRPLVRRCNPLPPSETQACAQSLWRVRPRDSWAALVCRNTNRSGRSAASPNRQGCGRRSRGLTSCPSPAARACSVEAHTFPIRRAKASGRRDRSRGFHTRPAACRCARTPSPADSTARNRAAACRDTASGRSSFPTTYRSGTDGAKHVLLELKFLSTSMPCFLAASVIPTKIRLA